MQINHLNLGDESIVNLHGAIYLGFHLSRAAANVLFPLNRFSFRMLI